MITLRGWRLGDVDRVGRRKGILGGAPIDRGAAAAMVAWLASDECSFTTGFTFDLSGGRATY